MRQAVNPEVGVLHTGRGGGAAPGEEDRNVDLRQIVLDVQAEVAPQIGREGGAGAGCVARPIVVVEQGGIHPLRRGIDFFLVLKTK